MLLISICLLLISSHAYAENQLNDVKVAALPDNQVEITLQFSNAPSEPLAFTTDNPARIALDFADTTLAIKNRFQDINIGQAKTINTVQSGGRTRVVVNLNSLQEYQTRQQGNQLILTIGDLVASAPQTTTAAQTTTKPASRLGSNAQNNISLIDFRRGDNNAGRVMISLSNPNAPISLNEQGGKIIVSFEDTSLAPALQKKFDVKDFATPVNFIEAYAKNNNTQIVIQPDSSFRLRASSISVR